MSKAILITGATGKQGGSVLRALLEHPSFSPSAYTIFAVTRNPESSSAKKLAAKSPAIKLVQGDLKDAPGIFKALPSKPWGVYGMTGLGKNEAAEGIALVDEAVKAGSSHFVFSSVDRGGANDGNIASNVPHFITKHKIEARLREASEQSGGKLTYTTLRPPFFLDNLEWGFLGKVVSNVWRDHVKADLPLAVIDTTDIGRFAAAAFMEPESEAYKNKSLNLAGDKLTFTEANKIFEEKTGNPIPTTYGIFASLLLFLSKDFRMMTKFWNDTGFGAVPAESKALHKMTSFADWVDKSSFVKKSN
ncbi:MAG: hypothetical protein MMC23_001466 [Stictis urceolatum]|nr:hypothetical protein [Stictis urceolata]